MRVLIDARYLDGAPSGIATYSRFLLENLSRVDKETEYLVVVRPTFEDKINLGENFELLTYRPKPISLKSFFNFHDLVEEIRPDILHSLAPHAPIFFDGPLAVTVHDLQPFIDPEFSARRWRPLRAGYNMFYRWAYPAVLGKAKWIICDSYATRDDVVRLMPGLRAKLIVVRPGLGPEDYQAPTNDQVEAMRTKLALPDRYLLYYGSTRPNKNLPNLVKSFARLIRQGEGAFDDVKLVLVLKKDRFYRDIARAINSRKVQKNVLVLDPLSFEEQQALLSGATAFVFPTRFEGFGFPPLEAMRAGVPVLAGDSGSLPEVIGDAGLLVDPDDLDAMAAQMRALLEDESMRRRLISLGYERINVFDWHEAAAKLRDIYRLLF